MSYRFFSFRLQNVYHILIIMVFILHAVFSFAQPAGFKPVSNPEPQKNKVQEYAKKTNTLESDFKQVKHLSMLTDNSISKGKFWFKKDNLLRWEYKEPVQYLLVLNNGKAYAKENGMSKKFDMTSNLVFRQVNDLMMTAVKGDILQSKDYQMTYFENNEFFLAELLPLQKNMKQFMKGITIWFDKNDFSVTKFRMTELSGDYTEVEFSNKKLNYPIENGIFAVN